MPPRARPEARDTATAVGRRGRSALLCDLGRGPVVTFDSLQQRARTLPVGAYRVPAALPSQRARVDTNRYVGGIVTRRIFSKQYSIVLEYVLL